jgi:hypothetical protein
MRSMDEIQKERGRFIDDAKHFEAVSSNYSLSIQDRSEALTKACGCRNAASALLWAVGMNLKIEHYETP